MTLVNQETTELDLSDHSETGALASAAASAPALAPKPPLLFPHAAYPPTDPGAPFPRSAQEGDGLFVDFFLGHTKDAPLSRASEETPADFGREFVRRLALHPHEASRFQTLTLAAFDLRHLRVAHVPGKQDVLDVEHPELEAFSGLVPEAHRADLVAVFNGGFQPRHGRWGMYSSQTQLIPPRDDACTVAVMKDGTVKIGPWPELHHLSDQILAYRQTPPCLVYENQVHPRLKKRDRRLWAGQIKDRKTRRRSVVGVSADGRTLFFGVGSETEAEVLAQGVRHAGAAYAAQLDINWNWTRLFLFDTLAGAPGSEPLGALIEGMAKDKGEYLSRPSGRGFFYLRKRRPAE